MQALNTSSDIETYTRAEDSSLQSSLDYLSETRAILYLCAACLVLTYNYISYKRTYTYWKKRGIKGPTPLPLVGNTVARLLTSPHILDSKWVVEYGKVYGAYHGTKPKLVVSDPEILRQICIKDSDVFINHEGSPVGDNRYQKLFLFNLHDDHWKKVRAIMSPTFTSGKIKKMFKQMDECAEDVVQAFREQIKEGANTGLANVKDLYRLYTMDAISTCCYGLKVQRAKGASNLKTVATRDEFVRMALKIFDLKTWRLLTVMVLPRIIVDAIGLKIFPSSFFDPMAKRISHLIEYRRTSGKKFDDYLQMLIDSNLNNQMELNESDAQENHHAGKSNESIIADQEKMVKDTLNSTSTQVGQSWSSKYTMTELETLSNAMFIMMVGVETTGSLLCNCTYALAFHQEIQEKLYQEVIKLATFDESTKHYMFDYDSLTSCIYLDAVLSESMRSMTTITQLDRIASRDYYLEKYNLMIEKGTNVATSFYSILNDPDYWEEPKKFNPDRFLPENRDKIVPGAYCPFGLGPRFCLGMRFSLTESKLALAKIITNFRFEPAPGTTFPAEFTKTIALTFIKKPFVRLIPRDMPKA